MPTSPSLDPSKPSHAAFLNSHPQAAANFLDDINLSSAEKAEFLAHIEGHVTGELQAHLKDFCYAHKKHGSSAILEPGEHLGVVRALSAMADRLVAYSATDLEPSDAEATIEDWATLPADDLKATMDILLPAGATITSFLMWSFRHTAQPARPTEITGSRDLPCRLGLPSYADGSKHVLFGHDPASLEIFAPTFFDSALDPQWRAGGNTLPHADCATHYPGGIPEVVHEPNLFARISTGFLIL